MVQDLLAAKKELKLRGFLKKISRYEVLILDDIGYVQGCSRATAKVFAVNRVVFSPHGASVRLQMGAAA
jgi:DNA replication protein DnaC